MSKQYVLTIVTTLDLSECFLKTRKPQILFTGKISSFARYLEIRTIRKAEQWIGICGKRGYEQSEIFNNTVHLSNRYSYYSCLKFFRFSVFRLYELLWTRFFHKLVFVYNGELRTKLDQEQFWIYKGIPITISCLIFSPFFLHKIFIEPQLVFE